MKKTKDLESVEAAETKAVDPKVTPLQDYMLIEKIEEQSRIQLISEQDKESTRFLVKAIGPGHYELGTFVKPIVKVGDIIFTVGQGANGKIGDKKVLFARARDVIAIL